MDYKFKRFRIDKMPREKVIEELERAAKFFNYTEFGWRDFNEVANISRTPVIKEFGTWNNAMKYLKKHLQTEGIELKKRKKFLYSDKELFDEMERIWKKIGQRPSRTEWDMSNPNISYNCYKKRFNGWTNACIKFIEYKMGSEILFSEKLINNELNSDIKKTNSKRTKKYLSKNSRDIAIRLRYKILKRDNYRCVYCGKSPATDVGVKLQIDHIIPFSKGGKTEIKNLQTLCSECNLGKSDDIIKELI
jgi:hypothetical protein